jgi:hypothetical protein
MNTEVAPSAKERLFETLLVLENFRQRANDLRRTLIARDFSNLLKELELFDLEILAGQLSYLEEEIRLLHFKVGLATHHATLELDLKCLRLK